MISECDPCRCPICRGIHEGQPCPLEIARQPRRKITPQEDAETRSFLARCTRGQQRRKRSGMN